MSSTRELEDSLPLMAPNHGNDCEPLSDRKLALYTLLALNDQQLQQLEKDIKAAGEFSSNDIVRLAMKPVFHGKSLLDVYNHHIHTRDHDIEYHPSSFIVADQDQWTRKGVLFVNLVASTEQRDSFIGVCRCDLEIATQIQANLDISNMDWTEYKEMEQDEFEGENPFKNPRYYHTDPTESPA